MTAALLLRLIALLGAALLTACGESPQAETKATKAGATAAAGAISVTSAPALRRDLPIQLEGTGAVVPVTSVDVKPQLTTVVTAVHVREGQFVNKGDLLFTLDTRTDEANVARLRAQMARDQASLADAQRQLARSRDLLAQKFVSQGAVDTNQSQVDAQAALVESDRAAVDSARVSLAYGRVSAPSAGRVGAVTVYPGTAVQANQTTLVTITQLDPIDVAFSVPQRHLGDVLAALKQGGAVVTAALPEGNSSVAGRLLFVDNAVDAASGAIKVKARFDNRDGKLWPGAFARATINVSTIKDATVIPQAAIVQSAKGPIAYVIEDGKAVMRQVEILGVAGDDAAVKGISAGERVVLDGRQNLRPGVPVVDRSADGRGKEAAGGDSAAPQTARQ
ncbi:MAG TPA: efflux RND transporter periplasmic adaptor subunit [Burkholderiaceae bacterium]|nr:efflux RND transporter periplasmic adaptor subunit [Burkholderiaceae bacterium]